MSTETVVERARAERPAERWVHPALAALVVAVAMPSLRLLFPHLYAAKETSSLSAILVVVLAVAASPLLVVPLRRIVGYRAALVVAVGLLAAWRVLVLILGGESTAVAVVGAVAGLAAVTLCLTGLDGSGASRGTGVLAGLALDVLVLAAFGTWDPIWRVGVAPTLVAVAVAEVAALVALLVVVVQHPSAPGREHPSIAGGLAVGGILALEYLFLADLGFVGAAWGRSLPWAVAVVGAGLAVALVALATVPASSRLATVVAGVVLAAAGLVLPGARGASVVLLVLFAQAAAGIVLGRALAPATAVAWRSEIGVAGGLAAMLVGVLAFQLHYDQPLPVGNRWITALLGAMALLASFGRRSSAEPTDRRLAIRGAMAVAAIAAFAGLLLAVTTPTTPAAPVASALRLVQWNVRQAVGEDGRLDPEVIAAAIEAQGADVVVLNEVGRGWPISGQLDLASWLARRLGFHTAWAGAASAQFGNLVLSRFPISDAEVMTLPVAGNAQGRSAVVAKLATTEGAPVQVIATHLQHRNDDASRAARMEELRQLLARWGGTPRTVFAGDLNPRQGDPPLPARVPGRFEEIEAVLAAGLTTTGELDACTRPTSGINCSDFVFVSPDLHQSPVRVGDELGDHRMLVTEVSLG